MAYAPCATCQRPFTGETVFTYVTWFDGDARLAYRFRHCPSCAAAVRNSVLESADFRNEHGVWDKAEVVPTPIGRSS